MAANQQQDHQALAPPSMPRSDAENANNYQYELDQIRNKRKKRIRCMAFITIFAIIQIIVILIIALAIIRVKSPTLRLDRVALTTDPTGDLRFSARVLVRNRNFARYKFDTTYATVRSADGNSVLGQFLIDDRRVRARSTKKIAVIWDVRSSNSSSRSMDLVVEARMRGKVEVFRVIKRRKWGHMDCRMTVNLDTNGVQNLRCM